MTEGAQVKSRIPLSLQTMLIAAVGLILAGSISVFGSAYTVNNLKNRMVEASRQDAQRMLDRIGSQVAGIIHARGVSTIGDVLEDPEIKRVLSLVTDQPVVVHLEVRDADGYPIREEFYEQKLGVRQIIHPRGDHRAPTSGGDQPPVPASESGVFTMSVPIRSDSLVRGHIMIEVSPFLAMGGVEELSGQISSNLRMMVFNVLAILLLTILIIYYALRRQMDLQRRAAESENLANLGTLAGGLAHEIRNPLHAMNLHLDAVREDLEIDEGPEAEAPQAIARVQTQIENLNGIVSNFLNLSIPGRIEMREMRLDQKVHEIVRFLQPEFDARGILVTVYLPGELIINGDPQALHQLLINILQNARQAVEKTTGGRVAVHGEKDRKTIRLFIDDSGPGISSDDMEHIFKAFVSKRTGGTGFGLYIARMIMERHGGKISARSSETLGGARFCLEFPGHSSSQSTDLQHEPVTVG